MIGAAYNAQADDTGCRAVITTLSGEKMQVSKLAARLLEEAFPGTQLLVFFDGGQSILDLGDLRRLSRISPAKEAKPGTKVTFSFKDKQGKTGTFKIWANYIFSGQIQEGSWSESVAKIKQMVITCPPPMGTPSSIQD